MIFDFIPGPNGGGRVVLGGPQQAAQARAQRKQGADPIQAGALVDVAGSHPDAGATGVVVGFAGRNVLVKIEGMSKIVKCNREWLTLRSDLPETQIQAGDVEEWAAEHADDGISDLWLVVGDARVPVSRSVLALTCGLVRDLPKGGGDEMPLLGDFDAETVVLLAKLCYPRLADHPRLSLSDIARLAPLAHYVDAPAVVELLYGQLLEHPEYAYSGRDRVPDEKRGGLVSKANLTAVAPSPDLYAAIFALDSAGKNIPLSDPLLLHFPTVFCDMTEPPPVFRRRAKGIFAEYTTRFEGVHHPLVVKGFATMTRLLLESYQ